VAFMVSNPLRNTPEASSPFRQNWQAPGPKLLAEQPMPHRKYQLVANMSIKLAVSALELGAEMRTWIIQPGSDVARLSLYPAKGNNIPSSCRSVATAEQHCQPQQRPLSGEKVACCVLLVPLMAGLSDMRGRPQPWARDWAMTRTLVVGVLSTLWTRTNASNPSAQSIRVLAGGNLITEIC
jgi:hypothetical protein